PTASGGKHSAHSLLQPHPHSGTGWKTARYHRALRVSIAASTSGAAMSASPPTAIPVQQNDSSIDTRAEASVLWSSPIKGPDRSALLIPLSTARIPAARFS